MANDMISLEKAIEIIENQIIKTHTENIGFTDSLNRVLAEDVFSDMNIPPFNKSAMDGYACQSEDIENELEIIEIIKAGKSPEKEIKKGFCSKIMTGAQIPEGADMVVMNEDVEIRENRIFVINKNIKSNICYVGEDTRKGDKVLSKGSLINPQHIAVMATTGYVYVQVYKKPVINVIVTGDELIEPQDIPDGSKIRNSNAYQLISLILKNGCNASYKGIVKDDKKLIIKILDESFLNSNFTIFTGGASKGDYDLIPAILKEQGFTVFFEEVAIQPGKPVCFAAKGKNFCFGLSGNPVSSFFQFELLVKPFIKKIRGLNEKETYLKMALSNNFIRKKAERKYFFPVKINENFEAVPVEFHGSAHINALIGADGIVSVKEGIKEIKKGDIVNVRPI